MLSSRALPLVLAAIMLASCGFHLQGAVTTPAGMQRTFIETDNRQSQFYREFQIQLLDAGVELVETPSAATAAFTISTDDTAQRVLSVSARNVPTEYEVYYTITYVLTSGTEVLLPEQSVTITRNYTNDPLLVLGKAKEEQLLRDAIVRDLVRVVMKQISTL